MENNIPKYRIKHVGINHDNGEEALKTANLLCEIFDLKPENETDTHIFAGTLFEVKKNNSRGKYGHIAIQTDDLEAAIRHLAEKGIMVRDNTVARNENGRIRFAYLDLEIAGFAFHLTL